jgi:hypothetical protein
MGGLLSYVLGIFGILGLGVANIPGLRFIAPLVLP